MRCSALQCVAVRCSALQCVVNPWQLHFPSHTNSPQAPHSYHCLNSQKVNAIDMYMLKCLASGHLRISADPTQHTLCNIVSQYVHPIEYLQLISSRTLRISADPIQQTLPFVLSYHSMSTLLNTYKCVDSCYLFSAERPYSTNPTLCIVVSQYVHAIQYLQLVASRPLRISAENK